LIGRNRVNLIVGWCGRFLFFVVPRQFSQDVSEWLENQILIPDWTYFHCPNATLITLSVASSAGRTRKNKYILHCPFKKLFHCPTQRHFFSWTEKEK